MDDLISERIVKFEKKLCSMLDDLEVLYRAEIFAVTQNNAGVGVATQLNLAKGNMKKAIYNLELAIASAEGSEVVEQMQADLDRFTRANDETED